MFLCIKDSVPDKNILIESIKPGVTLLGKNNLESIMEESIDSESITLGLLWKSTRNDYYVPFLNYYKKYDLFDNNEVEKHRYISNNLLKALRTIHDKNGVNVTLDLISCNLNSDQFKKEIKKIEDGMKWLNIRYSVDNTGNDEFKANWVLESDNVDIKNIYFNENISRYSHVLDNRCLVYETHTIKEIMFNPDTQRYRLLRDLDLSQYTGNDGWNIDSGDYVVCLKSGQSFDGNGYAIQIPDGTELQALFNVQDVQNKSDSPIIMNLDVESQGTYSVGDFCANTGVIVGNGIRFIVIKNCNVRNVSVIDSNSGGICGRAIGSYGGFTVIQNCTVSADNISNLSGGICSAYAGSYYGNVQINGCKVMVNNIVQDSAGICPAYPGLFGGIVGIMDCMIDVAGDINVASNGICGYFGSTNGGDICIKNCKVNVCGDIGNEIRYPCNCICGESDNTEYLGGLIKIDGCDVTFTGNLGSGSRVICGDLLNIDLTVCDTCVNAYSRKYDSKLILNKLGKDIVLDIAGLYVLNQMIQYATETNIANRLFQNVGPTQSIKNVLVNGRNYKKYF